MLKLLLIVAIASLLAGCGSDQAETGRKSAKPGIGPINIDVGVPMIRRDSDARKP